MDLVEARKMENPGASPDTERTFTVDPRLYVSPERAPVGTTVTVTGTGLKPGETSIYLAGRRMAVGLATYKGELSASFDVPQIPSGDYELETKPPSRTANLTVIRSLQIMPKQGRGPATVKGEGFPAFAKISIFTNDLEIFTVPHELLTDATGGFTAIITMPSDEAGDYAVLARDGAGCASARFRLVYPPGEHGGSATTS